MRRVAAASVSILSALACRAASVPLGPLPELAGAPAGVARAPRQLVLVPGERMTWNVTWHGFSIGRAELAVGASEVKSRFATSGMVPAAAALRHELTTELARAHGRPAASHELVGRAAGTTTVDAMFDDAGVVFPAGRRAPPDGGTVHTLHTTLGWLRAWAGPDADAAHGHVVHGHAVYRFAAARPVIEDHGGATWWRIDCRVAAVEAAADPDAIDVTLWLDAEQRLPRRIEVGAARGRVTAELIAHARE
jgi:hypothetical protein